MPLFDRKDKSRYASFTRRSLGMSAGMATVFAVLGGRLYQLQVRNGDQYKTEAEANRINQRLLAPPARAHPGPLRRRARQQPAQLRVLLVSEQATEGVEAALDTIGKVIQLSDAQKKRVLHDIQMNKKFVPVPVAENLSWEEFARINMHLPYLAGVQPDVGQTRDYPSGSSCRMCWAMSRRSARRTRRTPTIPCCRCRASASASAASRRPMTRRCAAPPAPAASRSTPMAASSASSAAIPACRARMCG